MDEPLISLCMIVKNEEASLPRCLQSIQGTVDEVVVVDTGSTDSTADIARSFGAIVVHAPWQADFAAARNTGLAIARGRWILFLDADEALEPAEGPQLRALAQRGEFEGFFLQIRNYVGNGEQGATINPVLRMFRNRREHRFQGRIHEQIASSIVERRPGAAFYLTELTVHHYGYQQAYIASKDKIRRNMALLETALAEEPDNAFYHYNMGVEYLRSGQPQEALVCFREASSRIDPLSVSYAHLVSKYEIRCLQALGQWNEALEEAERGLQLYPEYTDLLHCKAQCERALERRDGALRALLEAMKQGPPPQNYHTEEGIGTFQTAYLLGELEEERGEYAEALQWYKEALRHRADLTPPLFRIFHLLRITGREREAAGWIRDSFRLSSPGALSKIVTVLLRCRCGVAASALLHDREGRRLPAAFRMSAAAEADVLAGRLASARRKLRRVGGVARQRAMFGWLAGETGPWHDKLIQALSEAENGTDHGSLTGLLAADPSEWAQLRQLTEAGAMCETTDKFALLLQVWERELGQQGDNGDTAARTFALGLSAAADRHLSLAAEAAGMDAIVAVRLNLPREDGF